MSRSYTPGLKVLASTKVLKTRLLPMKGQVHYKVGDTIESNDIVASTKIPGNVHMVNVSKQLNIEPENIKDCMLIKLDDKVKKNQIIAENKGVFGFFKSQLRSPIDGFLENISDVTGQIIISEPPKPVEVSAYTSGTIKEVISEEGVVIETNATLIQGILGVGGENRGELIVLTDSPDQILESSMIKKEHKGKIIVGGSFLSLDAFYKAKKYDVAGIVTGGFSYKNLSTLLGYSLGVAITGSENIGPSIIITEGFGKISMAEKTYELLKIKNNKIASIDGSTQIRAGVIRPEILIPNEDKNNVGEDIQMIISEGSQVRVIREPYFGMVGIVRNLPPELKKMDSETLVRVATVEFENGNKKEIPRANLEMIIS